MPQNCKLLLCDYLVIPILSGFAAGMCISIGGLLNIAMLYAEYDISKNNPSAILSEIIKFGGAFCFSIGLLLVCLFRLHLYTGKIGKVFEKHQSSLFYISLPLMLLGNIFGAVVTGAITHILAEHKEFQIPINRICDNKTSFDSSTYFKCVINGIYCGTCVYFAVATFSFLSTTQYCTSMILLQFFISLFVYSGFEHCIANVFYFTAGSKLSNKYAYINFILVMIGNTLGPIPGVMLLSNSKAVIKANRISTQFSRATNHEQEEQTDAETNVEIELLPYSLPTKTEND